MKFLDRADDKFIQEAVDDKGRPWLIKETSRRRMMFLGCAVLISVGTLGIGILAISDKNHNSAGFGVAGIMFTVAAIQWMQVIKCESDLRLLKLVDKLKK